ncbi:hypothetical protein CRG98_014624 [Punica granatum]|uniref:Mechanosensitive ion channel protein 10-like n=1 Tax=Punica granatum TaxID=22663 RepID=A0A2I0KA36_PUNGR|nr:hypothetical protein CRG98_014624 [Punica granatum]
MELAHNRAHDHEYQKSNSINTNEHVILVMDQKNVKSIPSSESNNYIDPTNATISRTKTLRRLNFSKPKSRFDEAVMVNYPSSIPEYSEERESQHLLDDSSSSSDTDDDWYDNEDAEIVEDTRGGKHGKRRRRKKKLNKRVLLEWILFLTIMTCLICSLTLDSLQREVVWGMKIWKWCLMVMVTFCGRLVSGWLVALIVFLIERNFMLREKVLYFVYGLRKSFQNCAWLGLVLASWVILFPNVHKHHKVLQKLFRALIAVLIGATIWLLKILFVKVLASSFHVATFFDRMKESVFHHYILDTLSGPPLDEAERERAEEAHRRLLQQSKSMPARMGPQRTPTIPIRKEGADDPNRGGGGRNGSPHPTKSGEPSSWGFSLLQRVKSRPRPSPPDWVSRLPPPIGVVGTLCGLNSVQINGKFDTML